LTGLPFIVVGAILSFIDGTLIIPNGQLAPVLLLGLSLAAYGLARERASLVLIGAALSMIEPHIGLPAYCAIFVWRPRLRIGLLGVAALLAAISVVTLSVPINIEYVRVALPTQAEAEATTTIQYSLAWLLHYVGVPDMEAIQIASVQYAVFAAASIVLAGHIARRLNSPAAIALFPPVIALIGGAGGPNAARPRRGPSSCGGRCPRITRRQSFCDLDASYAGSQAADLVRLVRTCGHRLRGNAQNVGGCFPAGGSAVI
jgi:hypothetical protein